MEREARKNPKKAIEILPEIAKKQQFTQEELVQVKRRIVSSIMSTESAELAQWRDKELATNPEDSFIERRIRVAIRAADWDDVSNWIGYLTPTAKNSLRWQFWIAQIESKEGEQDKADARLKDYLVSVIFIVLLRQIF